jgi:ELWxxDGT repeat protein
MALSYFNEEIGGVNQLWVSDGTSVDTHVIAVFGSGEISDPTTIGSRVFFTVNDGVHGAELWTSDGAAAGTAIVKDIDPGSTGSFPFNLTNVEGTLYFTADDGAHGVELWKSDGTAAGTVMVKDIDPGASGSSPPT